MYHSWEKSHLYIIAILSLTHKETIAVIVKLTILHFKTLANLVDNSRRVLSVEFLYLAVRNKNLSQTNISWMGR